MCLYTHPRSTQFHLPPKPRLLVLLPVSMTSPVVPWLWRHGHLGLAGEAGQKVDWLSDIQTSNFRGVSIMFTVVWASIATAFKSSTTRSLQALSSAMERSNNIWQMWGGRARTKSNFDQWVSGEGKKIVHHSPHTSECSETQWFHMAFPDTSFWSRTSWVSCEAMATYFPFLLLILAFTAHFSFSISLWDSNLHLTHIPLPPPKASVYNLGLRLFSKIFQLKDVDMSLILRCILRSEMLTCTDA